MWKKVALGLVAVLALLVVVVALQPSDFRITRSVEVSAPPSAIAPHLTNFRSWSAWSPWEKLDPNMKRTYSGAASGQGAVYEWTGNDKVGSGRMEIVAVKADAVTIRLEFLAPFKATNTAEFTLTPAGDRTKVAWTMTGQNNFMAKAFGLVMNMDKLVGGDFERGLSALATVAAAPAAGAAAKAP